MALMYGCLAGGVMHGVLPKRKKKKLQEREYPAISKN